MRSYLKFLSRNKLYTTIEAVGLAVSLAFVILIGSYAWQQYAVTIEHPDRKDIYNFGMPGYPGLTYGFSGAVMQQVPEAQLAVRYANNIGITVWLGNKEIHTDEAAAVGKEFFTMFPYYRFVEGNPELFDDVNNVLISESFAKMHGMEVGQILQSDEENFTVAGILEDLKGTLFKNTEIWFNEDNKQLGEV